MNCILNIMIFFHIFLLSSLIAIASCHPLSYQKVRFVVGSTESPVIKPKPPRYSNLSRNSRSFELPLHFPGIWPVEETVFFPHPGVTIYDVSFERGHISPDYSDGLDYPDPLLLKGKDALIAVKYLYGRGELFYHQIPHIRALLRNQEERRLNGLGGNYLSSNRPGSPFYRA